MERFSFIGSQISFGVEHSECPSYRGCPLLGMSYWSFHCTIDGFHSIFLLGNWRALHHHAPADWSISISHDPFCPPVSMVKDAMESVKWKLLAIILFVQRKQLFVQLHE